MRVLIDGSCLSWGRTTGWERYTAALIAALSEHARNLEFDVIEPPRGGSRAAWETVGLFSAARHSKALLHFPAAPPSPLIREPRVTTVHDATLFFHPEWGSRRGRLYYRWVTLLQRADPRAWQLTPSVAARNDLLLAGFKASHVFVASPPANFDDGSGQRRLSAVDGVRAPFVLFIGTIEPRKNIEVLLRAWRAGTWGDAKLVIVGRRGWSRGPDISEGGGVLPLGVVPDDQLRWLLANANAVVSSSRYEGFGLPIAEALGVGTPVIATDIPASREIAGAIATYVPPDDAAALTHALRRALSRRCRQVAVAREIAYRYSPKRFADELVAAYEVAGAAS
jgi:glycosyltransferase involved in cell wall biosynthesis